jgi:hypothetical protein
LADDYIFRCTYCNRVVTRTLTRSDLRLTSGEEFVPGKLYDYAGCWCGWGKHVICEERKKDNVTEIARPSDDH